MEAGFFFYRRRARGGGRSLQGGQPVKIIPRTVWRGTESQAQSASPPPAARSPGRTFIYYTNRLYWCRSLYHPAQTPMCTRRIFRCNFLKRFIRTLQIYRENKPLHTLVTTTRVRMSIQSCMRHFKLNAVVKRKATEYSWVLIRAESVLQCYLNTAAEYWDVKCCIDYHFANYVSNKANKNSFQVKRKGLLSEKTMQLHYMLHNNKNKCKN